jgi:hypothetical protein
MHRAFVQVGQIRSAGIASFRHELVQAAWVRADNVSIGTTRE